MSDENSTIGDTSPEWEVKSAFDGQWTPAQIEAAMNRDNPYYPPNMLKRIADLETKVEFLGQSLNRTIALLNQLMDKLNAK